MMRRYDNVYPIRIDQKDYIELRRVAGRAQALKYRVTSCGIVRALIRQFIEMSPLEQQAMLHLWSTDTTLRDIVYKRATHDERFLRDEF